MKRTTKKRTWTKIAQGCYDDGHAIVILARKRIPGRRNPIRATDRMSRFDANGRQYTRLHNAEPMARYAQLLEDLQTGRIGGVHGAPGSLLAAIDLWERNHPIVPGAPGSLRVGELHSLLKPWKTSDLAPMQVTAIRRIHIVAALDDMEKPNGAPYAPTTIHARKQALGKVLRVELEKDQLKRRHGSKDQDADVIVPTSLVPGMPAKELEERGIDMRFVDLIIDAMSDRGCATKGGTPAAFSHGKIFMGVMAWTALPPASLKRLAKTKVRFSKLEIEYPARKKGKKPAPAFWAPAMPSAIAWLRKFDAANLWGKSISRSSLRKQWRLGVAKVRATLKDAADAPGADDVAIALFELFQSQVPANSRPYDLRHSFATEFLRRTKGNRTALQRILQHKDERMLERYSKGAIPDLVADAMGQMRDYWSPIPTAPQVEPLRLVHSTGA